MRNAFTIRILLITVALMGATSANSQTANSVAAIRGRIGSDTVGEKREPMPAEALEYRIGAGDALVVSIKSRVDIVKEVDVRLDGTVSFPLAGADIVAEGITPADLAAVIASGIKIIDAPKVSVAVSRYASHTVDVLGYAANPGRLFLSREAVPFYVIRAEAMPDRDAKWVEITSSDARVSVHSIASKSTDDLMIRPGDTVKFLREKNDE